LSPKFLTISHSSIEEAADSIRADREGPEDMEESVRAIVQDVRRRGDEALFEYAFRFDGVRLDSETVRVPRSEVEEAYLSIGPALRRALKAAAANIEAVCRLQLSKLTFRRRFPTGAVVGSKALPLTSIGCYVPGGAASYPSSLLMTCLPARVAGVKRTVVCTPCRKDGSVDRSILAAAKLSGVSEVYKIGGAHAVAAMAYGTETIKPVKKVVGPGGRHVTAAKKIVSADVPIDMPAGPTELVVYGDDIGMARDIMVELSAQAEHSPDTCVGLVTTDGELADRVYRGMDDVIRAMPRREIISQSWGRKGFVAVCDGVDTACSFINRMAPEHVALLSASATKIAARITTAGLVSVGRYTSTALCDYVVGVNHVLPTGGYASIRGGLSILDYVRLVSEVSLTKRAAKALSRYAETLARAEGLEGHAVDARRCLEA